MTNQEIFDLADELKAKKLEKEELDKKAKDLAAEIDVLDAKLTDCMTTAELDSFKRNGSTYYLKTRLFASPVAEKKPEFIKALKDNGCGELVQETVNSNTLASWLKEYRETHKVERPEFLDETLMSVYEKVNVGIRKSQ